MGQKLRENATRASFGYIFLIICVQARKRPKSLQAENVLVTWHCWRIFPGVEPIYDLGWEKDEAGFFSFLNFSFAMICCEFESLLKGPGAELHDFNNRCFVEELKRKGKWIQDGRASQIKVAR